MVAISYIRSLKFDIPSDYSYYRIRKGKTKYKVKKYDKRESSK